VEVVVVIAVEVVVVWDVVEEVVLVNWVEDWVGEDVV